LAWPNRSFADLLHQITAVPRHSHLRMLMVDLKLKPIAFDEILTDCVSLVSTLRTRF